MMNVWIVLEILTFCLQTVYGEVTWPSVCPRFCACFLDVNQHRNSKTVNCYGELFTRPPLSMPRDLQRLIFTSNRIRLKSLNTLADYPDLTDLNIASNHIYDLGDITAALPKLLHLNLDGNEMNYLENKTFTWSPNIHVLSLKNNKIEMIHPEAFLGLTNLQSLDLSGNRLFGIEPEWFRDQHALRTLDISRNDIHVLKGSIFRLLTSLQQLKISQNHLQHIYEDVFDGLLSLEILYLQGNDLKKLPSRALQSLPLLNELNFNKNLLTFISTGDVIGLNVTKLSLSHMDLLQFIDIHSFVNLTSLTYLDLSHNKRLNYLDPECFLNLQNLQTLMIHNNNLSVVEETLVNSLPSLERITVEGNSLFCDCNMRWLIDEYREHHRNLSLPDPQSVICHAPSHRHGKAFDDTDIMEIAKLCAPRILPLFANEYHVDLGDPVRLDCRAVGLPIPEPRWLISYGDDINTATRLFNTETSDGDYTTVLAATIRLDYAQGTDDGDYTCIASNPQGRDERTAHLRVESSTASVVILNVEENSVTVTWTGTNYRHQYLVMYRHLSSNDTYHTADIEHYMRTFNANSLTPSTWYQFCLAMKHGADIVQVNCTSIRTSTTEPDKHALFDAKNYVVGGGLFGMVALLLTVCICSYYVKRYNSQKRDEEDLYNDNLNQLFMSSMDETSDTSPLAYDNEGAVFFEDDEDESDMNMAPGPSSRMHVSLSV